MKERPILFTGPMVRSILDGSKTQTRRMIKMPATWDCIVYADWGDGWWPFRSDDGESPNYDNNEIPLKCPYGYVGERLWVRETCRAGEAEDGVDGVWYIADDFFRAIKNTQMAEIDWLKLHTYRGYNKDVRGPKVPAIHMPRWASRILLEITSVRVERLRDIGDADSRAEGVTIEDRHMGGYCAGEFLPPSIRAYRDLWESINGAGSWDANPWVWMIEFKRVTS